ncbi:MAG: M14 family zinc carboxypeptidase [Bacteroidales bacterium]
METSHNEDVVKFIEALKTSCPLVSVEQFGTTKLGNPLQLVIMANPKITNPEEAKTSGKPVIYIQGNIHAGEGYLSMRPNEQPTFTAYDHLPRYIANYVGLRNRMGILSETFPHELFEKRTLSNCYLLVRETVPYTDANGRKRSRPTGNLNWIENVKHSNHFVPTKLSTVPRTYVFPAELADLLPDGTPVG